MDRGKSMQRVCGVCREYCDNDSNNNVNALQEAIRLQHVECVKTLVEAGADVKSETKYYGNTITLLQAAVYNGNVEIVKVLIDAGADVKREIHYYGGIMTMMESAVRNGNAEVVKVLIEAGADVSTGIIYPVLVFAVQIGNADVVKALIDGGADVNPHITFNRNNPLATAALNNNTECLKMLLDAGADVNHRDNTGLSALFLATMQGMELKYLKLLIKKGAEVITSNHLLSNDLLRSPMIRHQQAVEKPFWLLFAAGVDMPMNMNKRFPRSIYTYPPEEEMSLKHLCRKAIRKHLLKMSPVNLFVQVPQLGLPTLLQEYLLFNVALDDDDDDDVDTDDDEK